VWALKEYGIRVIIANSFGAIFYNNCICNGLLPISLPEPLVIELARQVSEDPQRLLVSVDLQSCIVRAPDGSEYPFKIEPSHREMLLEGLDPIAVTLKLDERIAQFCERDSIKRPWNYSG
jgi:3-isopropylmalate/(R)-2-methylmalate dehydratase small subunit